MLPDTKELRAELGSVFERIDEGKGAYHLLPLGELTPEEQQKGVWRGEGVLGPEAFDAVPFLELLAEYGSPHQVEDRSARP